MLEYILILISRYEYVPISEYRTVSMLRCRFTYIIIYMGYGANSPNLKLGPRTSQIFLQL